MFANTAPVRSVFVRLFLALTVFTLTADVARAIDIEWTEMKFSAPWLIRSNYASVVFKGKIWVLGGYPNHADDVWYSIDGLNWDCATASPPWAGREGHSAVVFDNKIWILGGSEGVYNPKKNDVWYSSDGVNWVCATESAPWSPRQEHTSVVFDDKIWVIGGHEYGSEGIWYFNDVWYSSDGINWTCATSSAPWTKRGRHTSVVFDNMIWVFGGNCKEEGDFYLENDIWSSADGVTWLKVPVATPWEARRSHTSVVFDEKIWIIGGETKTGQFSYEGRNDVWYSSDGMTWELATSSATWSPRMGQTAVVFDGKIWVLGGYDGYKVNDVWYSSDGVSWNRPALWEPREGHTSVVFAGKIWVLGGYCEDSEGTYYVNDVWYSNDGLIWTQATELAPWSPRAGHTSVVFDDKIWIIGGLGGTGWIEPWDYTNDVWYSSDGVDWVCATPSAPWDPRCFHTSVVFEGKIWVIGGCWWNAGEPYNDVWYSTDGVDWTCATDSAPWTGRWGHSSVVYDDKIWIIRGDGGNDAWYSSDGIDWILTGPGADWAFHTSVVVDDKMWLLGGGYYFFPTNAFWYSTNGLTWGSPSGPIPWAARLLPASVVFDDRIWVLGGLDPSSGRFNDVWCTNYLEEPIPANLSISPATINLRSKGNCIRARLELLEDRSVYDIDPDSILLSGEVEAEWVEVDHDSLRVRFARSSVEEILEPGEVEVTVSGRFMDGKRFEGVDTIKVIDRGNKQ